MPERLQEEVKEFEPQREKDEWDRLAELSCKKDIYDKKNSSDMKKFNNNMSFYVAQFCHYYPGEFKSGEIGWRLFWILFYQIGRIGSIQRHNIMIGTQIGTGFWNVTDEGRSTLERLANKESSAAFGLDGE